MNIAELFNSPVTSFVALGIGFIAGCGLTHWKLSKDYGESREVMAREIKILADKNLEHKRRLEDLYNKYEKELDAELYSAKKVRFRIYKTASEADVTEKTRSTEMGYDAYSDVFCSSASGPDRNYNVSDPVSLIGEEAVNIIRSKGYSFGRLIVHDTENDILYDIKESYDDDIYEVEDDLELFDIYDTEGEMFDAHPDSDYADLYYHRWSDRMCNASGDQIISPKDYIGRYGYRLLYELDREAAYIHNKDLDINYTITIDKEGEE